MKKAIVARMTSYWRSVLIWSGLGVWVLLGCGVAQGANDPWVLAGTSSGAFLRLSQGATWTLDKNVASGFSSIGGVGGVSSGDMFVLDSSTVYRYRYSGTPYPGVGYTGAKFVNGPDMFGDIYAWMGRMIAGPDNKLYITMTNHNLGVIRVDPVTGARQTVASTAVAPAGGMAFGPDANGDGNSDLYVGNSTGGVTVYNTTILSPATPITTLNTAAPNNIVGLAFYGNNMVAATTWADDKLHVYDALTGAPINLGLGSGVFSTDGAFNHTGDLGVGYNGNLYAMESYGGAVRMYLPSGGPSTPVPGSSGYFAMGFYNLPEPASLALLALGGLMLLRRRR